ncbi:MAG: AzlC family ABC transporter permease [Varibaculum sp.]|nr:AzlC family ABC transporter permease [Varibaculum sp.]
MPLAKMQDSQSEPLLRTVLRDTWPICAGYIPLGMAYGMYAVSQGMPLWWIMLASVFMYTGAMQFAAAGLVAAGTGLVSIGITTLFVNVRHVFYGLSFPLRNIESPLGRAYGIHAITDETYALVATRDPAALSGRRVLFTEAFDHCYWILGTLLGVLVMHWVTFDATFMSFALTALFIVLFIDSYRQHPIVEIVIVALACSVVGLLAGKNLMLLVSLTLFTGYVALRSIIRQRARVARDDDMTSGEHGGRR